MKQAILLLTILLVIAVSATQKLDGASVKKLRETYDPLPGLSDSFCHGIDRKDGRTRGPIFDYSYTLGQTWTNPVNSITYLVPDNVRVISTPTAYMDESSYKIVNMTDVKQIHESWGGFHIGIPCFFFQFDYTRMSMHMREEIANHTRISYLAEHDFSFYRLQTFPYHTLSDQGNSHFTRMMNYLPETCNTDAEKHAYWQFRELFGTDYSPEADYGGSVQYLLYLDSTVLTTHTEDWAFHQVSLAFQWGAWSIGINVGRNASEFKFDKDFTEHVKMIIEWQGGSSATNVSDYHQWQTNVVTKPVAIHPRLSPISDLFLNQNKKACMNAEIASYLNDPAPPTPTMAKWSKYKARGTAYDVNGPEWAVNEDGIEQKVHLPTSPSDIPRRVRSVTPIKDTAGVHGSPVYRPAGLATPYPPAYGADSVGYGYDATTSKRRALPVVELTYNKGHTWTNPFNYNQVFSVPDQHIVMNVPSSFTSNATDISQTYHDYQHSEQHTTRHGGFLGFGSKKTTTKTFVEKTYQEDYSHSDYNERHAWYKMALPPLPPPKISAEFAAALSALPASYNPSDPINLQMYMDFIATFGTHYMTEAYMGGAAHLQTWFHSCFLSTFSEKWVSTQGGWSLIIISNEHGSVDGRSEIDANFWSYSDSQILLIGGSVVAFDSTQLPAWRNTLSANMAALEFSIEPISDLIYYDPGLQSRVLAAITDYMKAGQVELEQYAAKLNTNEPHTKPAWCKW